jgi:hypothetical protein
VGLLGLVLGTGAVAESPKADGPKIEAIRRLYQGAIAKDDSEEQDNTGGLTLSGGRLMPGSGQQDVSVTFHEVRVPVAEPDQPGRMMLRLITVKYNVAANPFHQEYLLDDAGQLVFYFSKDPCGEQRTYFDGGKLLRVARQRHEEDGYCQEKLPGPARVQKDAGFSAAEQQRARELQENAQTLSRFYKKAIW